MRLNVFLNSAAHLFFILMYFVKESGEIKNGQQHKEEVDSSDRPPGTRQHELEEEKEVVEIREEDIVIEGCSAEDKSVRVHRGLK